MGVAAESRDRWLPAGCLILPPGVLHLYMYHLFAHRRLPYSNLTGDRLRVQRCRPSSSSSLPIILAQRGRRRAHQRHCSARSAAKSAQLKCLAFSIPSTASTIHRSYTPPLDIPLLERSSPLVSLKQRFSHAAETIYTCYSSDTTKAPTQTPPSVPFPIVTRPQMPSSSA